VTVAAGKATSVTIELVPFAKHGDAPATVGSDSLVKQWWFWTAIGAGVVTAVMVGLIIDDQ